MKPLKTSRTLSDRFNEAHPILAAAVILAVAAVFSSFLVWVGL